MLASTGLLSFSRTLVGYPPPMEEEHPRSLGCRVRSIQLAHVIILFPRRSRTPLPVQSNQSDQSTGCPTHTQNRPRRHTAAVIILSICRKRRTSRNPGGCVVWLLTQSVQGQGEAKPTTQRSLGVGSTGFIGSTSLFGPPALRLFFNSADVHRQGTTGPRKGAHRRQSPGGCDQQPLLLCCIITYEIPVSLFHLHAIGLTEQHDSKWYYIYFYRGTQWKNI